MDRNTKTDRNRIKNLILTVTFSVLLLGVFIALLVKKPQLISEAERRPLTQFPKLTYEEVSDGDYFDDFEKYALDQFIFRDAWRSIKAASSYYLIGKQDNNGLYCYDGALYKIEETNKESWHAAGQKIESIAKRYDGLHCYYSVIPDKNTLVSELSKRPSIDMALVEGILEREISSCDYIDIKPFLTYRDFYATDLHWNQVAILNVADAILLAMKNNYVASQDSFFQKDICGFYGSYYRQAALPVKSEILSYFTNEVMDDLVVTHLATKEDGSTVWEPMCLYDEGDFYNIDPYDVFVGGPETLVRIKNPRAGNEKKLYLFRDSFGSSLSPLLIGGYSEIVLIDLRYIPAAYLDAFVEFEEGNDMLFLYSNHILNESTMLR